VTRIAFVKFGGLAAAGTERWLQMMAANLPRDRYHVEYFYCDPAPYIGSDWVHAPSDPGRERYLRDAGVPLVRFRVGAKDLRTPTHEWVDTDFWDVFDPGRFDLVQTAKAGPSEYPYYRMPLPVVEFVSLDSGVDPSPTIAWSIHLSNWQRARWLRHGGRSDRSCVIPIPALPPQSSQDLRAELGIEPNAIVAGFHQRADQTTFSDVPLKCFAALDGGNHHFVLLGGASHYRRQARELGLRNVHFLDHTSSPQSLSRFLNTLDVFAHGRFDGETFGAVLAEAMMHGKPCLSHRSPSGANAQGETMGPGGLFAADPAEYAKLLANLFESAPLRAELGARGREHAREFYSLDRAVRQLHEVFQRTAVRDAAATLAGAPCLAYGACDGGARLVWHPDARGLARHHVEYAMNLPQWGAHLFPTLASAVPGAVLDLAPAISLFTLSSMTASSPHPLRPYLLLPEPRFAASVRRTVEVNRVRSPVTVAEGRRDSATTATTTALGESEALEALRNLCRGDDVGIVVIDAAGARAGWLPRLGDALGSARPVIVIEPSPCDGDEPPDPAGIILCRALSPRGYECLRATPRGTLARGAGDERGTTLLFLHPSAHRGLRRRLVAAARRWAASRRAARVVAWPARVVRGARQRVRAMIAASRARAARFAAAGPRPDALTRWRSPSP
jgi:glycosyltransferase involved in cell wall biosynthesis